jgi:hypothetical protein
MQLEAAKSCCQAMRNDRDILAGKSSEMPLKKKPNVSNEEHCKLKTALRKLWSEHAFLTKRFVVSYLGGLNDVQAITERLMKNQQDIGDALKPFYGKEAGQSVANLLKDHIKIASEVVKAAKAGDDKALKDADARWHKNADEIAAFLAKANPTYWNEQEWKDMFYEHLQLVTNSVNLRLKKQWSEDMNNFDVYYDQILEMADTISYGILHQFPNKF